MTLSMKSWAVTVLVAFLVAVSLAMFLVPGLSWAASFEWFTTQLTAPRPCACMSSGN
jgi:hypothetical protein